MGFIKELKEEFEIIKERDPALKSPMEVLLYPSFRVMLSYRRAHKHYLKGHFFRARYISQKAARKTGRSNWKRILYRPWYRRYHRRDINYRR